MPTDRPTPLGTTPEPSTPSPEPWKVALAEELGGGGLSAYWNILSLISKHHDPSCPTPTRTEREARLLRLDHPYPLDSIVQILTEAVEHGLDHHACDTHGHEVYRAAMLAGREWLAEARKALEVKP